MDLTLTEDQELIASTARDFLEARCPMTHVRAMNTDALGYSPELWKEIASLGWTGMALPEEHGGFGAGFLELCLVIEEMGRHLLPGPFLSTVLCATALAEHGTQEQKARLASIAAGDMIMTYARAAPSPGWPDEGSSVTAKPSDDGFVLSGDAMFVPFAHVAHEIVVITQAEEDPVQLTAFLIPSDALRVEPLETVGGDRQHRIVLEDVPVTQDAVLGAEGGGRAVIETVETYGAAATCAEMVGGAQRVLEMTVQYATERKQFGTPIGSFQAIQHHCADMGVDVLGSRLLAFEAIWRLAEGLDANEEVSMATAWVSEAYRRVCATGHQVHGAIGFTLEHDLHHYLRHAMSTELSFGDGDHHWVRIADHLGLPNKS